MSVMTAKIEFLGLPTGLPRASIPEPAARVQMEKRTGSSVNDDFPDARGSVLPGGAGDLFADLLEKKQGGGNLLVRIWRGLGWVAAPGLLYEGDHVSEKVRFLESRWGTSDGDPRAATRFWAALPG